VQLALGEFDAIDHLPNHVLLCGGGSSLDALFEKLQNSNWYQELPFTRKPSVKYIDPSDIVGMIDETGYLTDHTMITAAGLLRVGYDTIVGGNSSDTWKDKLNRILRI